MERLSLRKRVAGANPARRPNGEQSGQGPHLFAKQWDRKIAFRVRCSPLHGLVGHWLVRWFFTPDKRVRFPPRLRFGGARRRAACLASKHVRERYPSPPLPSLFVVRRLLIGPAYRKTTLHRGHISHVSCLSNGFGCPQWRQRKRAHLTLSHSLGSSQKILQRIPI